MESKGMRKASELGAHGPERDHAGPHPQAS